MALHCFLVNIPQLQSSAIHQSSIVLQQEEKQALDSAERKMGHGGSLHASQGQHEERLVAHQGRTHGPRVQARHVGQIGKHGWHAVHGPNVCALLAQPRCGNLACGLHGTMSEGGSRACSTRRVGGPWLKGHQKGIVRGTWEYRKARKAERKASHARKLLREPSKKGEELNFNSEVGTVEVQFEFNSKMHN